MPTSHGRHVIHNVRYALFIEPAGRARELVEAWKTRLAARWPDAHYVAHPPHATIWTGAVRDEQAAYVALTGCASALGSFNLSIGGPHVFYDDPSTGRGQTLAFAAVPSAELSRMQYVLCEALAPHVDPDPDEALPPAFRSEPFAGSSRRYGFPFVGDHWIPHLTAASVPVDRSDPIVAEFLQVDPRSTMTVDRVSWWRIAGPAHDRLASIPLLR
jgi:hypothetical protein